MLLLKNKNNILPIDPAVRSLQVTGPNAASLEALLGNYYGLPAQASTFLEGMAVSLAVPVSSF